MGLESETHDTHEEVVFRAALVIYSLNIRPERFLHPSLAWPVSVIPASSVMDYLLTGVFIKLSTWV